VGKERSYSMGGVEVPKVGGVISFCRYYHERNVARGIIQPNEKKFENAMKFKREKAHCRCPAAAILAHPGR
jgi:hypothetical protein